ncbi:MAG: S-layer homology domain-containing protein [Cyanobacteria bacterium SIG30]|nr:S-layer homology domain-containing protein [Cyanobacteria bacterium SIG30]
MKIKNFIMGATVAASLFALTVPVSYAACDKGCPVPEEMKAPCAQECSKDKVQPCNSQCTRCNELQDDCNCPKEITTGAAANICDTNKMTTQIYAYPNSVYGNSKASVVGEDNNATIFADQIGASRGVFVENTDCLTGAAAPVIGDTCFDADEINMPCGCDKNTDTINIQSPTSIEATKNSIEPLKLNGNMTGGASSLTEYYPDVPDNHWAAPEIDRLTEKCVLAGYPDGYFKPNRSITRAEVASMLVKGYNLEDTPLSSEGNFADVPNCHWAHDSINKAATNDMIEGHNGKFMPNKNITRAEALTMVSKGVNCPMDCEKADEILSQYSDSSSIPSWAKEPIAKAIQNGALDNMPNSSNLNPNKKASRAEVASMLQNMRIAGGYDSSVRSACGAAPVAKSFVHKETKVSIPTLELTMNDMINSKNANVGEQFAATTVNPITIGSTTYPAGSRVNGKIVEVIRPTKNNKGAIKLSFNEIVGCDGEKYALPKQILTARVHNAESVNGFARFLQWPFTWTGSLIGTTGRTIGGMIAGVSNAAENVMDNFGTGTSELLTGQFKASGRSYQDSAKALVKAPVDVTRTALSGTLGLFQTTTDEIAYLVDKDGFPLSQVNPKQKITIAFGE